MGDIKQEIKEIKQLLQPEKKEGKFKLPRSARVNIAKAKKNWITLMRINENGFVTFKKVRIEDQTFMEEGIPRLAAAGYITYYKKNPMIILPSWSVEPFSPLEHYQKSLLNGSNSNGYKLLINRMKLSTVESKKSIGKIFPWIIGIGLAVIIGYAFLTGGG